MQAPLPGHSSAATTAAAPARSFSILAFLSLSVIPSRDSPGNPWDSASCMANISTSSSLAESCPNAVAPSSCISQGGSSLVFSSPHSSGVLAHCASGILARCGQFAVLRAVNGPLLQSISRFLPLNHGKARSRSYALIGTIKTSNSSTGLRCSKYCTKRLGSSALPGRDQHLAIETLGGGECWFVGQFEFPE